MMDAADGTRERAMLLLALSFFALGGFLRELFFERANPELSLVSALSFLFSAFAARGQDRSILIEPADKRPFQMILGQVA